jgi:hypothetical protein
MAPGADNDIKPFSRADPEGWAYRKWCREGSSAAGYSRCLLQGNTGAQALCLNQSTAAAIASRPGRSR